MLYSNGTVLNFSGSSGCNSSEGVGENQQISWGCSIYLGRDSIKIFTKIEAYAGISERLVRDLAIEGALQYEIKDTLENNNQSFGDWCALSDKGKITTRLNLP